METLTPKDVFYFTAQVGEVRDTEPQPSNFYRYILPLAFKPEVEAAVKRATDKWTTSADFGQYDYTQEFLNDCMKRDNDTRRKLRY